MKRLPLIAAGLALIAGIAAVAIASSFVGTAEESAPVPETVAPAAEAAPAAPEPTPEPVQLAQSTDADAAAEKKSDDGEPTQEDASDSDKTKEEKPMTDDTATAEAPEQSEAFKKTMHEGDVALGVCGARVSALLWFYEASVAQGREDLKPAVESLTESRETIKKEAERRAVEDKVDTSVRVMNSESEKIWNDLNEKAGGDAAEFQKAHDELVGGVQECLDLFFDRPGAKADDAKSE